MAIRSATTIKTQHIHICSTIQTHDLALYMIYILRSLWDVRITWETAVYTFQDAHPSIIVQKKKMKEKGSTLSIRDL